MPAFAGMRQEDADPLPVCRLRSSPGLVGRRLPYGRLAPQLVSFHLSRERNCEQRPHLPEQDAPIRCRRKHEPALFMTLRDETDETPGETGARSYDGGRHT